VRGKTTDVSGAYRHVPIHADSVRLQGITLREYKHPVWAVDLRAAFGNASSGYDFGLPAAIIQEFHTNSESDWRHGSNSIHDPFRSTTWADDTTLLEHDVDCRLTESALAQYKAMVRILGPDAIAVEKDSEWFSKGPSLGLIFDFENETLSMKPEKIQKSLLRIEEALGKTTWTRTFGDQLIGSLRYTGLVIKPSKAFFKRIHRFNITVKRGSTKKLTKEIVDDLLWLKSILPIARVNNIPFTEIVDSPPVDVKCIMDASSFGSCAVDITNRRVFINQHTEEDKILFHSVTGNNIDALGINVLELSSAVQAALIWCPEWTKPQKTTHVQFQLDNMSAIAWINKKYSPNTIGQDFIRLLTMIEVLYNLQFSAIHVPGVENTLADAGSRMDDPSKREYFLSQTNDLQVRQLPSKIQSVSTLWSRLFSQNPGPNPPGSCTSATGTTGNDGVETMATKNSWKTHQKTQNNFQDILPSYGLKVLTQLIKEIHIQLSWENWPPSKPFTDYKTFHSNLDLQSTKSAKVYGDCPTQAKNELLSTPRCSTGLPTTSTGTLLPTYVTGGSLQPPTFSSCVDQKSSTTECHANGIPLQDPTSSSGTKTEPSVQESMPRAYRSTLEVQNPTNKAKEQQDLWTSQDTKSYAQYVPRKYLQGSTTKTTTTEICPSHKPLGLNATSEKQQNGLKQQHQRAITKTKNLASIHLELEEQLPYSTRTKTPPRSNSSGDGNQTLLKDTQGLPMKQPEDYHPNWSSNGLIHWGKPTTRPHPGFRGKSLNRLVSPKASI
jgi:hypothetical protein